MADKVIVTHVDGLRRKYGAKGLSSIREGLKTLIAADAGRGITTKVFDLGSATVMKKVKGKKLADVDDCRGAKEAIDAVFRAMKPDYVMILGATDVVPHQDLKNPAYDPHGDDDRKAWGDLPYACDVGYGTDPAKFVGPTRVVGRLPDLVGATDPSYLIGLLKTATLWSGRLASAYHNPFGLSAKVWHASTALSVTNTFGPGAKVLLSPDSGPAYPNGELGALMHFINCHGGDVDPQFYGQEGNSYPESLTSTTTNGQIKTGTVASVECCYGAQLYDSQTLSMPIPICQSYLKQGAYAYFGSTTIAYGPASGNGAADLICQYFLRNVLDGASIGRAALMARQQFAEECKQMDPIDLKTLAQFCLYGDPSVHPVRVAGEATKAPKGVQLQAAEQFRRNERRAKLRDTGEFLRRSKPTASKRMKGARTSPNARLALSNIAEKGGLPRDQKFDSYAVKGAKAVAKGKGVLASAPSRYYLAIARPKEGRDGKYRVVVIAKEVAGRVIDYRIYHER